MVDLVGVWDPDRAVGLVLGGSGGFQASQQKLWHWRNALTEIVPTPPWPSARANALLAWDRSEAIFGGGTYPYDPPADTWSLSTTWTARAIDGPFPRTGTDLTNDPSGLVLFGGRRAGGESADTWLWRDHAWTEVQVPGPSARADHALAYDPIRNRAVLYGGRTTTLAPPYADTWEWDGAAWTMRSATATTGGRAGHRMYFEPARRRVVAIGQGTGELAMTEWDPALGDWAQVPSTNSGPDLTVRDAAVFYDPLRRATIAIGRTGIGAYEVWEFRYRAPSARETCNTPLDLDQDGVVGCADPDCWGACTPHCSPGVDCDQSLPRCGDNVCNLAVEDCRVCPGDCGACVPLCGDNVCDPGETCPGDC